QMTKKELLPGYNKLIDYLTKQPGIIKMAKQLKKDYPNGIPGSNPKSRIVKNKGQNDLRPSGG
ncbi:unnamed protein product, partial [marine sediment metagenome]